MRVVQHILGGYYQPNQKAYVGTFTQEWPLSGQQHQISYMIPYQQLDGGAKGIGDLLISPPLNTPPATSASVDERGDGISRICAYLMRIIFFVITCPPALS